MNLILSIHERQGTSYQELQFQAKAAVDPIDSLNARRSALKTESVLIQRAYQRLGLSRQAERMSRCCNQLLYELQTPEQSDESYLALSAAHHCGVRLCPSCQERKARRLRARASKAIPAFLEEYPKARPILLTLTIADPPMGKLRSSIQEMKLALNRLSKRKEWPALGWIVRLEITKDGNGNPHPHFHVLMFVRSSYFKNAYISQARWLELWQESLHGIESKIVDVRRIKPKDGKSAIQTAILETFKYCTKSSEFYGDDAFLEGLTSQLHGLQDYAFGGKLRAFFKEDKIRKEPIERDKIIEHEPKNDIVRFNWNQGNRRYDAVSIAGESQLSESGGSIIEREDKTRIERDKIGTTTTTNNDNDNDKQRQRQRQRQTTTSIPERDIPINPQRIERIDAALALKDSHPKSSEIIGHAPRINEIAPFWDEDRFAFERLYPFHRSRQNKIQAIEKWKEDAEIMIESSPLIRFLRGTELKDNPQRHKERIIPHAPS